MASLMELASFDLSACHQKAVQLLAQKLAPIPKHTFIGGRKPTIEDIYKLNPACFPEHIPRELGLACVFNYYDLFSANGFSGAKFEHGYDMARATWYWGIDKTHSLSRHHVQVLVNFILAGIMLADRTTHQNMAEFLLKFVMAFLSYNTRVEEWKEQEEFFQNWYNGPFDLIKFPSAALNMILRKIKALKKDLPSEMPFHPSDFLLEAHKQDRVKFCEHVVTWAVYWYAIMEPSFNEIDDALKVYNATEYITPDDITTSLADMGMDLEYPAYLTPAHFDTAVVKALFKTNPNVQPAKRIESIMWMEPAAAAEKILNSDLSGALQNLSLWLRSDLKTARCITSAAVG